MRRLISFVLAITLTLYPTFGWAGACDAILHNARLNAALASAHLPPFSDAAFWGTRPVMGYQPPDRGWQEAWVHGASPVLPLPPQSLTDTVITADVFSMAPGVVTDATDGTTFCPAGGNGGANCTVTTNTPVSSAIGYSSAGPSHCGHTMLLPAGVYSEPFSPIQNFTACTSFANPWLIKLQGVPGAGGTYATLNNTNSGHMTNGKGGLLAVHGPVVFDHLEIAGTSAGPGGSGTGCVYMDQGVPSLIIMNSYLHDCQDGILTSCCGPGFSTAVIYNTHLAYGGGTSGLYGHNHNIYAGDMTLLVFVNNLSDHAQNGHEFKSRAGKNFIIGNRLLSGDNVSASIVSATYNPTNGWITATLSGPITANAFDPVAPTGVTGTGAYNYLNTRGVYISQGLGRSSTINFGFTLSGNVTGGTYDSVTGIVTVTTDISHGLNPGDLVRLGLTGTGPLGSIDNNGNPLPAGTGTSGTTISWNGGTGVAGITITGGTFNATDPPVFAKNLSMTITGGTITDQYGTSSYEIDLPNDTLADIEDNVMFKGLTPGGGSPNAIVLHHGGEVGPVVGDKGLIIANNTIVSTYGPGLAQFVSEAGTVTSGGAVVRSTMVGNTIYGITPNGVFPSDQSYGVAYGPPANALLPIGQAPAMDYSTPMPCS